MKVLYHPVSNAWTVTARRCPVVTAGGDITVLHTGPNHRNELRQAKSNIRVSERRHKVVDQHMKIQIHIQKKLDLSSAHKLRNALHNPEIRHLWRDFTYPTLFHLRARPESERDEIMQWLEERNLRDRVRLDVPFTSTRRYRRPVRIHIDVIDFRNPDEQFEFKVRWL